MKSDAEKQDVEAGPAVRSTRHQEAVSLNRMCQAASRASAGHALLSETKGTLWEHAFLAGRPCFLRTYV